MNRRLQGEALRLKGPGDLELAAVFCRPEGEAPGKGWPVVAAFHGLTLDGHFFSDLAAPLAARGIALLALDFYGHGVSGGSLENTTLQGQSQEVAAALEWLGDQDLVNPDALGLLSFSMASVPLLLALSKRQQASCRALALWAPLLNTAEWSQRRLRGFQRGPGGRLAIWQGRWVYPELFTSAQALDPKPLAEKFAGPLFVAHADRDENQLPSESHSLALRRQRMGFPVESYFPPMSGHMFAQPQERAMLLERSTHFFDKNLRS